MKKLLTVAFLSVALLGFGMSNANASGPFCIELTGFCDQVELSLDGSGNIYGEWDWDCTGLNNALLIGNFNFPTFTAGTYIASLGTAVYFVFDFPSRTFDLVGYDGVNPPFYYQIGAPWAYTVGPCVFSAPSGQPSLLGDYINADINRRDPVGVEALNLRDNAGVK